MRIIFNNSHLASPKVSIVLLDWSCRESFHILDYLADQTVPREYYEVVWIEYYDRCSDEINTKLKEYASEFRPPPVDQWLVMEIPRNVYYHKHLMYNAGIILSRGKITVICDSDALVKKTFIETILCCFEENPNLVLHVDEVRNNDRRFYPFNYPQIEEVIGEGAINWMNGKTSGLWDDEDSLHTRNYGACMAALRQDLINIGGADEHINYLGHICGPYEMTFRLGNSGKKEFWHPTEFLYHVWHPGQAGEDNYLGPHDGRHMSTTALRARTTGRIFPLIENPAVRTLRTNGNSVSPASLIPQLSSDSTIKSWSIEELKKKEQSASKVFLSQTRGILKSRTSLTIFKMMFKQFWIKLLKLPKLIRTPRLALQKLANASSFFKSVSQQNLYIVQQSRQVLDELAEQGMSAVSVYGAGDVTEIIYGLTSEVPIKIQSIYDDDGGKRFLGFNVLPVEVCANNKETIIIAANVGVEEKIERLRKLGVERERIVLLQ